MKKHISILLILVIMITSFSSCLRKKPSEELYNYSGSFTTYMYSPDSMNPLVTKYKTNAQVLSIIYSPLYKINSDLSTTPVVALSHNFKDNSTLEISLNSNVVFSDGSKLTANDVIKSLEVLSKNPDNLYYSVFDYVSDYQKNGDYSLTLYLKQGGSSVIPHLNFPILKEGTKGIGSGPYNCTQTNEKTITLTASQTSITQTKIKNIYINLYPKKGLQNIAYLNNELNVVDTELYDLAQFSSKKNTTIKEYTSNYFTFLSFNTDKISDINIRKAIAYSLDKNDLTSTILVGHAVKTASPYKPGTIYDTTQTNDYAENKEKVTEYLSKSNLTPKDIYLSILVNNETPSKIKTAEYISSVLSSNGMNVNVLAVDFETYNNKIKNKEYDMFIGETLMPESYDLSFLFKEDNILNCSNPALGAYVDKINFSTYAERPKVAAELSNHLLNELPIISLYFRKNMLITTSDIIGDFDITHFNIYSDIVNWQIKEETAEK